MAQGIGIAIASSSLAAVIYFLALLLLNPSVQNASQLQKDLYNAFQLLFWGIGFSQIIHILPIALWLRRRRQTEALKGLLIGAAIICLLCGGCFAVFNQVVFLYFLRR